jgi:hypothetical protein
MRVLERDPARLSWSSCAPCATKAMAELMAATPDAVRDATPTGRRALRGAGSC